MMLALLFRLYIDNLEGSIDEPVEDGDTALHLACLYGKLPCVQVGMLKVFLLIYLLDVLTLNRE